MVGHQSNKNLHVVMPLVVVDDDNFFNIWFISFLYVVQYFFLKATTERVLEIVTVCSTSELFIIYFRNLSSFSIPLKPLRQNVLSCDERQGGTIGSSFKYLSNTSD
jgi:hypothetical protein